MPLHLPLLGAPSQTAFQGAPAGLPIFAAPIVQIGSSGAPALNQPGIGFFLGSGTLPNGQTFAQYANSKLLATDLVQATYANRALLSTITTAQMSLLVGPNLTSVQIADAIVQAQAGGANARACANATWADETVTDLVNNSNQILNGYVQELGPTCNLSVSILAGDTTLIAVNPQNNGFPSTNNFLILMDTEQMLVTAGASGAAGNQTWTISRAQNGTVAAGHNTPNTITGIDALNAGINNLVTSITLSGNEAYAAVNPCCFLIESEQLTVTAGTYPGPFTVIRGDNGTTAVAHTVDKPVHLVWNDIGIISWTTRCHNAAPRVLTNFSPLGQQLIAALPTVPALAQNSDQMLFETQRSQNDANYVSEMVTTVGQIRAANGGKPIVFQMNAYDALSQTQTVNGQTGKTPYNLGALIAQTDAVIAACNLKYPDIVTCEVDGRSLGVFTGWVSHYRPP